MLELIDFGGWKNCIRISNADCELVVSTEVGPRILRFGFIDGQNFFHLVPDDAGKTGGEQWRLYGGHRLWIAPEAIPRTFYPDNYPVSYERDDLSVRLSSDKETVSGVIKEIKIHLSRDKNQVRVTHRLTNMNDQSIELCAWGLSMMAQHGRAIIPQEPWGDGDDYLLPARTMALWQYTQMNDPRWTWGNKYIQAKQDPEHPSEQKIGVTNKQGWTAYCLKNEILIKKFAFDPKANYIDGGSNHETYINGQFLEIETLSSNELVAPGESIEHTEYWLLVKLVSDESEESIDRMVLPLVDGFKTNA